MQEPPLPASLPELLLARLGGEPSVASSEPASVSRRSDDFDPYKIMAPQYAYGRHRGPAPRYAYRAAVMAALLPDASHQWVIPLTLRPPQLLDHAGQVSLPGGRAEGAESAWGTSTREFEEELGVAPKYLKPIGTLPSLYVYASRHRVTPVIGVAEEAPRFAPNPAEVAELLLLPVGALLRPDFTTVETMLRGNSQYQAPGFWVKGHFVWGATAMILAELRSVILQTLRSG